MTTDARPSYILVVDDDPISLQILAEMLREGGYLVTAAANGQEALMAAQQKPPDLVILDVLLPDMDGYAVCQQFKATEPLKDIPILFISGLGDTMDKVKSFQVGGVDYVVKPFHLREVLARVETHLQLRRQKMLLQQNYQRLQELERLRDDLTHLIIHDLRTPLTNLLSGLQTLQMMGPDGDNLTCRELLEVAIQGGETLLGMINDLLDVKKMEEGFMKLELQEIHGADLVEKAVQQVKVLAWEKDLQWIIKVDQGLPPFSADGTMLRRVLINLLGNAIKFTPAGGEITLTVQAAPLEEAILFTVADTGEGVPREYFERIFEKFGQVELRHSGQWMSTGLGLAFCKMAVEAHGGRIWVESDVGKGSQFSFIIPLHRPEGFHDRKAAFPTAASSSDGSRGSRS